jgi:hypothetical protein
VRCFGPSGVGALVWAVRRAGKGPEAESAAAYAADPEAVEVVRPAGRVVDAGSAVGRCAAESGREGDDLESEGSSAVALGVVTGVGPVGGCGRSADRGGAAAASRRSPGQLTSGSAHFSQPSCPLRSA